MRPLLLFFLDMQNTLCMEIIIVSLHNRVIQSCYLLATYHVTYFTTYFKLFDKEDKKETNK
jgi:hypothetical protein